MKSEVFACSLQLLRGHGGERCFEEARGEIWFQFRFKSPFDQVSSTLRLVPSRSELPMEALLMHRYARQLMTRNGEEHMSTAWDDPFISAEVYIQIKYLLGEFTDAKEKKLSNIHEESKPLLDHVCRIRRRTEINSAKSPLDFGEGGENSLNNGKPSYALSKRALLESRQSDVSELPHSEQMPLNRGDHHLIDVSNYFLEQTLYHNKPLSANAGTSPTAVTQLFSPGQVRELLLKPPSVSQTMKVRETEGVGPWCSKFAKVFWTKIAPRVVEWSSYFAVGIASPSKSIFQFGQQRYVAQCRFGSGTYGIVYLVRLLPPEDAGSDATTAVLDATTVGCLPEQQQRISSNNGASVGILRVVKLEEPDFPLEFYYMREARRRVVSAFRSGRIAIDVRPSICPALALTHSVGHFSCLLMPFYSVGLLNLLNYGLLPRHLMGSKRDKDVRALHSSLNPRLRRSLSPSSPPSLLRYEEELVALYLSLELLWIAEGLHNHARIIHGDIKPDNFRINDRFPLLDVSALDETATNAVVEDGVASDDFTSCLMSGRCTKVLVLLDFGLCIDMARFPPGTVFKAEKKRSFPCIEMLTGRPWTYQLDLFNIAGVIYTLVFKRYMEVECFNGEWRPKVLPRSNRVYRAIEVWRSIFLTLLNVRSCAPADYPNLASLRAQCEAFLRDNATDYNVAAEKANAIVAHLSPVFNG